MKLIIDIPDMIFNILNGDSSWKGLSIDYILNAVKDGKPLEAQPTANCKGCYYNDGETHAECVVCDKAPQPTELRMITSEGAYVLDTETMSVMTNGEYQKKQEVQPCEDAISREAVIQIIENKLNPCTDMFKCLEMSEIKEDVEHLSPVQPQRMQGEWIEVFVETPNDPYRYGFKAHKCSKCEYRPFQISDYCPNCGAEMNGGDSE